MSLLPITGSNSSASNNNAVNNMIRQLNNEQTTKVFKGPNGNTVINGKLPYTGGYGSLYYDANGVPIIVIGICPDGTTGLVIAKPNIDVLTLFS